MKITNIKSKKILTKSKLPGSDYVINPYVGCAFGCSYCYADFMGRFSGHSDDRWGEFVDVKINAPELLKRELELLNKRIKKVSGKSKLPLIILSSVTDPYQGVEAKYRITRKCLEVIAKSDCKARFSILTKSPLVTRDIDVIKRIENISVGFTITTTDDKVSRLLEGCSPPASQRIKALKKLNNEGVQTYVCINPLLPHFVVNENDLRQLLTAIRKTGNREVWFEHINLGGNKLKRIKSVLADKVPGAIKYFEKAKTEDYKADLNRLLFKILKDYDFKIGGGGIIDHKRRNIIVENEDKNFELKDGWIAEKVECGL